MTTISNEKAFGQFFTTSEYLKSVVFYLIKTRPDVILEPSVGRGDLVEYVQSRLPQTTVFEMCEIDPLVKLLPQINCENVVYCDFLSKDAFCDKKYKCIIGNPPYVCNKTGNLYIKFIKKCFDLLCDEGELIFIIPSVFFKLTSASGLINKMMQSGNFTHIIHPNDETLFENASIDVTVFRYFKTSSLDARVIYNEETKYVRNTNGILTFHTDTDTDTTTSIENCHQMVVSNYFNIYVGMVSGKESVFKSNLHGNINVITGEGKIEKYIYVREFPTGNTPTDEYLLLSKPLLLDRKIRKFTDANWYEWGALRNIKAIERNMGKDCIYISTITRSANVCFQGKVQYFGGSLLMLIPKESRYSKMSEMVSYLNSTCFKSNYMYSGRFRIGHKQLCNVGIPHLTS
jgi:adenine-specific DNA-methyltransferase